VRTLLQLVDRRHDLEQIADDAVVGHFEDRRVAILVDRDDRARSLHADQMLNRAGDAERHIQLGRDRLPELPIWRSIGSHPLSQIGATPPAPRPSPRRASPRRQILLRLDAAADATIRSA
jgi:hypothetical protein